MADDFSSSSEEYMRGVYEGEEGVVGVSGRERRCDVKGRDAFCSFDDEVCVCRERACGLRESVWVEDDGCAYLLVSCDGDCSGGGVEDVLHYNAREKKKKKSLCDGLVHRRLGGQGKVPKYSVSRRKRRIINHRSPCSTSISLPTDVSSEERRFDPVHTDEQSIPPAEAHVHVGTFPEPFGYGQ